MRTYLILFKSTLPFCFIERDLSIWDIAFISCDYNGCLRRQEFLQLLDPYVDLGPRLQVGDVIHYQSTFSALVVDLVECMISLLTGGVPDVELDLSAPSDLNSLTKTARIDGTYLLIIEVALAETQCQRGLPHTGYKMLCIIRAYPHRALLF